MRHQEAISYLESFINYERHGDFPYKKSFKLQRVEDFLNLLNNPQENLKVIHVAGTKGKGSVCAFIAYILREAGFKVGLYTSPHLSDFRERIRILYKTTDYRPQTTDFEGMITRKDVCSLVSKLKPSIEEFNKKSKYDALSFFEVYTALAFLYFKEKKVDFVVLETGLGGRLDATNTCSSLVSVITPISYEHTISLGKTLSEIAFEKASIIKKQNKKGANGKIIALTSKQDEETMAVIEKVAKRNNALLLKEGKDFKVKDWKINLLGEHQKRNASLSVAAVDALRYHNIKVDKRAIEEGLKRCRWPARLEIISRKPLVIIDGAQNAASVKALAMSIKNIFPNKKIWLVFGISRDKELKDTCCEAEKISNRIILTKSNNPRAAKPEDLLKYFHKKPFVLTSSSSEALNLAKEKAEKGDLILVTGSLFLCGEVREYGR